MILILAIAILGISAMIGVKNENRKTQKMVDAISYWRDSIRFVDLSFYYRFQYANIIFARIK